jgi:hypothetical protein
LLLVANNAPDEFNDWIYGPNLETVRLPVASVSGLEGPALVRLARQGRPISVSGGLNSPWVYDLQAPYVGRIPHNLAYRPARTDLARIDSTYYGDQHRLGGEFRYDFRPFSPYATGYQLYTGFPQSRVEWVNNPAGAAWYKDATVLDGQWQVRGERELFKPGHRYTEKWFDPVIHPRLGSGYWRPERQSDFVQINLPSFGDSGRGHTGGMDPSDQTMWLYHGKELIKESRGWQSMWADLPARRMKLRVVSDARRPSTWKTSTYTRSEYTFWTEHADPSKPAAILPLVQVNFHVDTDLAGDTKAGRQDTIGFDAWTMADAAMAGRLTGGRFEVSYDGGASWHKVALTGKTGHWKAHLTYPKNPARSVSLRATAWDSKGNRVTQAIISAYGLK